MSVGVGPSSTWAGQAEGLASGEDWSVRRRMWRTVVFSQCWEQWLLSLCLWELTAHSSLSWACSSCWVVRCLHPRFGQKGCLCHWILHPPSDWNRSHGTEVDHHPVPWNLKPQTCVGSSSGFSIRATPTQTVIFAFYLSYHCRKCGDRKGSGCYFSGFLRDPALGVTVVTLPLLASSLPPALFLMSWGLGKTHQDQGPSETITFSPREVGWDKGVRTRNGREERWTTSIVHLLGVLVRQVWECLLLSGHYPSRNQRESGQEQANWLGLWYRPQTRGVGGVPDDSHSLAHSPGRRVVREQHFSEVNFPGVIILLFCLEDPSGTCGK